ncbi:DsbA family protein, partial [Myxococcota bacterium]|nr:DsbA family protein [Myxococcota bacterium]
MTRTGEPPPASVQITAHYDFASTLCYVGYRTLQRLAPFLDQQSNEIEWSAIHLSRITGWTPGTPLDPLRRQEVRDIAQAMDVAVQMPEFWPDSYQLNTLSWAIRQRDQKFQSHGVKVWQERIFSDLHERPFQTQQGNWINSVLQELNFDFSDLEIRDAAQQLEVATRDASEAGVSGLPCLQVGGFLLNGAQDSDTLRSWLSRVAEMARP